MCLVYWEGSAAALVSDVQPSQWSSLGMLPQSGPFAPIAINKENDAIFKDYPEYIHKSEAELCTK